MELGLERHAEQPALTGVGREARRVVRHPVRVQRTVVREDEHGHLPSRLSSFISQNWRGKPLISHEVIVNLIAATTTNTGPKVRSRLDKNAYCRGAMGIAGRCGA